MWENIPAPFVYMIIQPTTDGGAEDLYVGSTNWFDQATNRHSKPSPSGRPPKYQPRTGARWIMAETGTLHVAQCAELFLYLNLSVPLNLRMPPWRHRYQDVAIPFLRDYLATPIPAWAAGNRWYLEMWHCVVEKAFRHAGLEPPKLAAPFCTGRTDGCPWASGAALASAANTSRRRCGRCNEGRQLLPH